MTKSRIKEKNYLVFKSREALMYGTNKQTTKKGLEKSAWPEKWFRKSLDGNLAAKWILYIYCIYISRCK